MFGEIRVCINMIYGVIIKENMVWNANGLCRHAKIAVESRQN